MRLARGLGLGLLALALGGALAAQQPGGSAEPGRILLRFEGGLAQKAAAVNSVTLDGAMLQLGIRSLAAQEDDAAARRVLAQLKGVYVKSFRFAHGGDYSSGALQPIRRQLQRPGWSQIMNVHDRDNQRSVEIYLMTTASGVAGMVIIAASRRELRVVNLVGPMDPAALSQLGGHFGIPHIHPGKHP